MQKSSAKVYKLIQSACIHIHYTFIVKRSSYQKNKKKQKHMIIINLVILKTMIVKKILQAVREYVK